MRSAACASAQFVRVHSKHLNEGSGLVRLARDRGRNTMVRREGQTFQQLLLGLDRVGAGRQWLRNAFQEEGAPEHESTGVRAGEHERAPASRPAPLRLPGWSGW